jgi:fumarylacetoacetase
MTTASWVPVPEGSDFPVRNLPYGVFEPADARPRVGWPSASTCSTWRRP